MSNFKKSFLIAVVMAVSACFLGIGVVPNAKAATVAEIQAMIANLQAQIAQLQQQLNAVQEKPAVWCHNFQTALKYGNSGKEVNALQTVLVKEGFNVDEKDGYFGAMTASAVTGFQQKYKDEVLKPWGLKYGTGYIGATTRKKLNELYGCGSNATPPTPPSITKSITVLSPNGGEVWKMGETRIIKWSTVGYSSTASVQIGLRDSRFTAAEGVIAKTTKNSGSYI
jgi:outer membrane murein-binding lipoprotein Lpp